MNPKLGVSEVATAILAEAAEALGAAGGLGTDGRRRNFEFMSTVGVVEGTAARVPVETRGPNTDAFRTGKVVRIEHAEDWRREYPKGSPLLGAEAVLGVPISAAGRRIGAIGFGSTGSGRSRRTSFDLAARWRGGGQALERARLFEAEQRALRRRRGCRTSRLGSSGGDDRGRGGRSSARRHRRRRRRGRGDRARGRRGPLAPGDPRADVARDPEADLVRPSGDRPRRLAHVYRSGRAQVESEAAWTDRFAEDPSRLRARDLHVRRAVVARRADRRARGLLRRRQPRALEPGRGADPVVRPAGRRRPRARTRSRSSTRPP